jgi:hypothetical protein
MEAQGYQVQDNVLFQDNTIAILLEKNGKASSSKCTKHIKIRYFFITDQVKKGYLSLVWCPMEDIMIGNFMTRPLQGALFWKFRDQIMGVIPARDPGPRKAKPRKGEKASCTQMAKPRKGKAMTFSLVHQEGPHHRSVLGVMKRTKDSLC